MPVPTDRLPPLHVLDLLSLTVAESSLPARRRATPSTASGRQARIGGVSASWPRVIRLRMDSSAWQRASTSIRLTDRAAPQRMHRPKCGLHDFVGLGRRQLPIQRQEVGRDDLEMLLGLHPESS